MKAIIVCGSPQLCLPEDLGGFVVGVDRGAFALIERNIEFAVAVGDFDSVSVSERAQIEEKAGVMLELPAEKDVTDCEAAVQYTVGEGYREIYLYGATGARFDHQFATIGLMLKYAKRDVRIYLEDTQNRIFILRSGTNNCSMDTTKKYVSFFALEGVARNLTLEGVEYPLNGYDLAIDDSLCVSNKPLGDSVNVSFDSGYLLVVQSSD